MSKRTNKPVKFPVVKPGNLRSFQQLNKEMHNITVSTPIIYLLNRFTQDPVFRAKVQRLL